MWLGLGLKLLSSLSTTTIHTKAYLDFTVLSLKEEGEVEYCWKAAAQFSLLYQCRVGQSVSGSRRMLIPPALMLP